MIKQTALFIAQDHDKTDSFVVSAKLSVQHIKILSNFEFAVCSGLYVFF